jgi:hypothetical protein
VSCFKALQLDGTTLTISGRFQLTVSSPKTDKPRIQTKIESESESRYRNVLRRVKSTVARERENRPQETESVELGHPSRLQVDRKGAAIAQDENSRQLRNANKFSASSVNDGKERERDLATGSPNVLFIRRIIFYFKSFARSQPRRS